MTRRLLLSACVVFGLFFGLCFAFFLQNRAPFLYWAKGRSDCSLIETYRAFHRSSRQIKTGELNGRRSKLLNSDGRLRLIDTPQGRYWAPLGINLPEFLAEFDRHSYGSNRSGDIVLDVGANIGAFTRKALADGAAKVICIEPAPDNVECLRRNLAKEIESGAVVIVPQGAWDQDGNMELSVSDNSVVDSMVIPSSGAKVTVPVTTIDAMVANLRLPRVDFIKMDIEGAEKRALRGARQTISQYKPRLAIATEHEPDDHTAIPSLIHDLRFDYIAENGPAIYLSLVDRVGAETMRFH